MRININRFLSLCVCAAGLLAGCHKETVSLPDNSIRISAAVSPLTRGGYDRFTLDEFRFFVLNAVSEEHTYRNVLIRKTGDEFTSSPLEMRWQNSFTAVDLVAMTRSVGTLDSDMQVVLPQDQRSEAALREADFLYFRQTGFLPSTHLVAGQIPLKLEHKCAKISISLLVGGGTSSDSNPVTDFSIEGVRTECGFHPGSGTWSNRPGEAGTVLPFLQSYTLSAAHYECVVIPQKIAPGTMGISFEIAGQPYHYRLREEILLEEGTLNTLDITIP